MMNQESRTNLNIQFTRSKDFRNVAVTGVCGGANPQGEIICGLYIEQQKLPANIKVRVDPATGKIEEAFSDTGDHEFMRELQVQLVMRPDIAVFVGEWLINEAKKVINAKSGQPAP